ncbi:SMI1/KNR4 family protein [Undibacterium pigrum]|uniref:SUKH superfamily protein n=1 Tax=Undibacterium pigrum TaxID=401470 RepID=A0A318IJN1_9BURK|nr:SMI1/KNR4 family protein [Undibacterium pigrum]PXX33722.1 SUKH superfamily protein [Undibacterium pigrum]
MFDWESFGIMKKSSVDSQMVALIQGKLKVIFPESYIDLMKYSDGSCPEISSFEYQDSGTCISEFFEFSDELRPFTVMWYTRPNGVPNLPERYIPIARDAGDYLICLNFNISPPAVEIFDPASHQFNFIAHSFSQFVSLWHE